MKGDFTRDTFKAEKHYQHVLMQQGRVQLDADCNEQAAIASRRAATTTVDLVGDCGGPAEPAAFGVFTDPAQLTPRDRDRFTALFGSLPAVQQPVDVTGNTFGLTQNGDFFLSPGRYYVNGIQCENEFAIPYTAQTDRLDVKPLTPPANGQPKFFLIYLDVWHRHLTALDDPGMREPALGGPDTGTRVKTIWQVRHVDMDAPDGAHPCGTPVAILDSLLAAPTARLSAMTALAAASDDPCEVPESAGYKGLENQLYRVEIHQGSTDAAGNATEPTWKWSRENGSVAAQILRIAGTKVTLVTLGPDERLGFRTGDWVELLDDALELEGQPGQLLQVVDFSEAERTLTLSGTATPLAGSEAGVDPMRHPKVRRWEGTDKVIANRWLMLENAVQIRFDKATATYRTGDFWQIPARAATAGAPSGDIEWPRELNEKGQPDNQKPLTQPPRGITHHYCRLGIAKLTDTGILEFTDCRCLYPALTGPRLEYVGGDGQEVMPDLTQPAELVPLPQPIAVFVANLQCDADKPDLCFTVKPPSDKLILESAPAVTSDANGQLKVPAASGIIRCQWQLDPQAQPPDPRRVDVSLVDQAGHVLSSPPPLFFTANLSRADQVAYQPTDCAGLSGQKTVQAAIARLASMASIYKVSGDGQPGNAGANLKAPLKVRVASRCIPVPKMTVTFTPVLGGGSATPTSAATDENGDAECAWRVGNDTVLQVLEAEIAGDATTEPRKVHFVAHLTGEDGNDSAPVHVVGLQLSRTRKPLPNDATVVLEDLKGGLAVLCDRIIEDRTVVDPAQRSDTLITRGQPTCFITAEIPFPLSASDMQNFEAWKLKNFLLVGYQPVVLHAAVSTSVLDERPPEPGDKKPRCEIRWLPDESALNYLSAVLTHLNQLRPSLDRLLLRLTLKGNFIWSAEAVSLFKKNAPGGFLDGEAFRAPRDFDAHEIVLPSGDGRRGGDLEMWFWLAPQPEVKTSDKVTDVKTSDVKVTEVKVTDTKVRDTKATEVKTVEVKVSDRSPISSVGGPAGTTKRQGRRTPKGRSFITPEERPEPGPETREDPGKGKARAPRDRKPSR